MIINITRDQLDEVRTAHLEAIIHAFLNKMKLTISVGGTVVIDDEEHKPLRIITTEEQLENWLKQNERWIPLNEED